MNFTTFYFLLCIIFAGRGDERWKKRTRENTYIVEALDESTEMEQDLLQYEDNFNVDKENEFYNNVKYKLSKHKKHRVKNRRKPEETEKTILDKSLSNTLYINNPKNNISEDALRDLKKNRNDRESKDNNNIPRWPKFEDLLTSVGVKYDFKSDRWIKLKGNNKRIPDLTIKHFDNEMTHQKHEFKYRTIRINGRNKRKNIIIALTAIR